MKSMYTKHQDPSKEIESYLKNEKNMSDEEIQSGVKGILSGSGMDPTALTPNIIEEREMRVAQMDVFSRLMMDRIIFLGTQITDEVSNVIKAQLLYMENEDENKDVNIYINTPGGNVYSGLGLYDTMQYVKPDIATTCTGMAASMGSIILCAGTEGKRSILRHSRVMIHQPMGGTQGQATDIEITAREIVKLKEELYQIISEHTGQDYDKVYNDGDRDFWLTSNEAKDYGVVDQIIKPSDRK